jgi:hypothetical protein
MKTKHILALLAVITVALVGCSSLTQAPQLKIIKVDPVSTAADSVNITVSFRNMNHVDAIISTSRYTFKGLAGSEQSPVYNHTMFVPGDVDSVALVMQVAGLANVRATLGSPVTLWLRFWGTDAYGYNKTFATYSVAVNCN